MDILISSNLERMLFEMTGGDDAAVRDYMGRLNTAGRYQVSDEVKEKLDGVFASGCCDDRETQRVIGAVYKAHDYLIDPHTAVAFSALEQYRAETGDETPCVVVSTASPYKVCDSVLHAIGEDPVASSVDRIDQLQAVSGVAAPKRLAALRGKAPRFDGVTDREKMEFVVLDFLR